MPPPTLGATHVAGIAQYNSKPASLACGLSHLGSGAKLHTLLRRAWARHRPIDGGAVLGPTSPRERHVYNRAAKFYDVAFALDPGESGRTLDAWLRRAPMETDEPAPAAAS